MGAALGARRQTMNACTAAAFAADFAARSEMARDAQDFSAADRAAFACRWALKVASRAVPRPRLRLVGSTPAELAARVAAGAASRAVAEAERAAMAAGVDIYA